MQASLKMSLPATVKKKGKYYISNCPALDVFSQGDTEKKALDNLIDALSLFLISCFERGTLDEVLKECGFEASKDNIVKKKPVVKKSSSTRYKNINVPIPLQYKRSTHHSCHA